MIEICQFQPDEIDEAIEGMDGLQEILVPILRRASRNGNGTEQDIKQFQRHVMLAKHALGAMGDLLEERMEKVSGIEHFRDLKKMVDQVLADLRRLSVETGSLACFGCGREHNCGVHGCRILRDAATLIQMQQIRINELRGHTDG